MRLRHLGLTVALICAAALALALPALASAAPMPSSASTPAVTLTLKAPIAVRVNKLLTVQGTASTVASAGETVTVSFERKAGSWTPVRSIETTLSTGKAFAVTFSASSKGHWRVTASIEATSAHKAAALTRGFKVVGSKVIALTFDDGPWPSSTASIVGSLKKGDAQATFFTLGSQIKSRVSLLKSEVAGGNLVEVHSWNHALMTKRSTSTNSADLAKCKKAVKAAIGVTPRWFRPPYGATNTTLKRTAEKLGLKQVIWSVDTLDWKYRVTSSVVSRTMSGARDGAIVLMHDGGGPRGATAAAVPIVIKRLRAKGYSFVTLDEMAALGYKVR